MNRAVWHCVRPGFFQTVHCNDSSHKGQHLSFMQLIQDSRPMNASHQNSASLILHHPAAVHHPGLMAGHHPAVVEKQTTSSCLLQLVLKAGHTAF